ncbi:ankyrin repeat-containing domain protein [Gymnopilus junonius]|uniref:Ankyrin repeat-containing domain protein n=1 Tax=Gymnopilus junonius TaxID=109634 RepID=A0A9P5NN11_GYMJU|nr:ankyrin repeat-containing domain protein [Gymnopilus junonius]
MIKKNKALVQKGDTDWTFGQTLALLLLLVPLRDLWRPFGGAVQKPLGRSWATRSCSELINLGAGSYYKDLSLVSATQDRHLDVVKYLLEHGANVNSEDRHGSTAVQAAISCKDLKTVEYLLDHGANLNKYDVKDQSIIDLLFDAIERCFNAIVKHLLEYGVNAEYALISASYSNNLDAMKLLLDYGADVNFQTKNGDTALRGAVQMGHLNITAYLVEHGADMTLTGEKYHSIFSWAIL